MVERQDVRSERTVDQVKRTGASLLVTIAMLMPLTGSTAAAIPSNDDRADATNVASAPFQDGTDTTEATIEGSDPDCWEDEAVNATVWYSFTPTTDATYGVTSVGSSYPTAIAVGIPGVGGAFDFVRCSWPWQSTSHGISWYGRAGQQYLIMVGAWGQAGGDLVLEMKQNPAVVRFPKLTIAATGKVTRQGYARITGRLACRNVEGRVPLYLNVKQRLPGRPRVNAYSARAKATCGQGWTAVAASNRAFRPGKAKAHVDVLACNAWGCDQTYAIRTVKLIK